MYCLVTVCQSLLSDKHRVTNHHKEARIINVVQRPFKSEQRRFSFLFGWLFVNNDSNKRRKEIIRGKKQNIIILRYLLGDINN